MTVRIIKSGQYEGKVDGELWVLRVAGYAVASVAHSEAAKREFYWQPWADGVNAQVEA